MKKIPTIFERDWEGDRSRVLDKPHPDCGWVFAGDGIATRKFDGTCCLIRGGKLYKRRELRATDTPLPDFEVVEHDPATEKIVGWIPVGDGPEDRWHRAAYLEEMNPQDGTYELIGPKVQGNPENWMGHQLIRHGSIFEDDVPRTFDGLRDWLARQDIEGIVFHHKDGRMAKIKLRDFGIKRTRNS